jgi:hypothetical protein
MTRDNFEHVLRRFLARRPCKPFTVELVSGSRIEIQHPEALTVYREGLISCQSSSRVQTVFEYTSVIRFIDATGTA